MSLEDRTPRHLHLVSTEPAPSLSVLARAAAERLERAGLSPADAAFDAALLARSALGWDRATWVARSAEQPPSGFAQGYERLVSRRERREPAAQVLGYREFWGRPFAVTRDVLVPRPETELIVEAALGFLRDEPAGGAPLVDVGTGSGCLAITLSLETGADIVASDISVPALAVAKRNARELTAGRVHFVCANLLDGLAPPFHVMVANPPYVRSSDRPALSPEVREYEPGEALFGGIDGLEIVRALLDAAAGALAPRGRLFMEFGAGQDDRVVDLVQGRPRLRLHDVRADLQGIPRMAVIGLA